MVWTMVLCYALFVWTLVGGCSIFLWPHIRWWHSNKKTLAIIFVGGPIAWIVAICSIIKNR